jgi:hypothetical protein
MLAAAPTPPASQKYAVAGTLNGILSMAGKMMGEDGVTGLEGLTRHTGKDIRSNYVLEQEGEFFAVADVERLLAAAAVGEGVPDLHNAIKAAFIAGFKESGEGWNYEMLCDPESDPHFVARMNDYLAVTAPAGAQNAEAIRNQAESGDARDAARYRWLRNPDIDVGLVLDKRTGWVPPEEGMPGIGGYHTYEYRAGDELDAAIDQAMGGGQTGSANTQEGGASAERSGDHA